MYLSTDTTIRLTAFRGCVQRPPEPAQGRERSFSSNPPWMRQLPGLRALCPPALNDRKERGAVRLQRGYAGPLANQIPL